MISDDHRQETQHKETDQQHKQAAATHREVVLQKVGSYSSVPNVTRSPSSALRKP